MSAAHLIMTQRWKDVFFSHWPVPESAIRPLLPPALAIDTFDGRAWAGVVHMRLDGIFLKGARYSVTPSFPEINVRTYVKYRGEPGIFFLSLDAGHWATYTLARLWYKLNYVRARVTLCQEGGQYVWQSKRFGNFYKGAIFKGSYVPLSEPYVAEGNTLAHWLTERYRLFSVSGKRLFTACTVHHPWLLQDAAGDLHENALLKPFKLPAKAAVSPACVHYSPGMDAHFTNIHRLL